MAGFFMRGRMGGMRQVISALFSLLFLGFWLPPLLVGRWFAHQRSRVLICLATAGLWTPLWLVLMFCTLPPYHGRSPDAGGLMIVGVFSLAFIVLPVSAIACWIGAWHRTWQGPLDSRIKMGISLSIFALMQLLLLALLWPR